MKICHYLPSLRLDDGGPPRSVSNLCKNLIENNLEVTLATSHKDKDPEIKLDSRIVRKKIIDIKRMDLLFENNNFNLGHQHGIWLPSSHRFTSNAYKTQTPLVLAPRGMLMPWALKFNFLKKKIAWLSYQKRDLKKVSGFHATSIDEAKQIRKLGFTQPIGVIPNGVNMPDLSDEFIAQKRFSSSPKKVLFLSRLHEKKGLDILLKAWKKLSPKNAILEIIGNDDGGYKAKLISLKNELGLGENVIISEPQYGINKDNAFKNADLFVLPSYSENFGIVVAEALSFGVPVITTKGCPWQDLETYKCGWWTKPELSSFMNALSKALILTRDELYEFASRGRQLVIEKYQWSSVSDQMLEFYDYLLYNKGNPSFLWK